MNKAKIKVVDSIMGQGKTTWAINYMKNNPKERFMYITPFLDEVERVKQGVEGFVEPIAKNGSKLTHIRELVLQGENVVSTHSLMGRFDSTIQEAISAGEYTLILDEVADVVNEHKFYTESDKKDFFDYYAYTDEDGYVRWDEEKHPIEEYSKGSKFYDEMVLCLNGNLVDVQNKLIVWELPVDVFKKFKEVYILTYLFEGSVQKPYFDSFDIEYDYLSVKNGELIPYEATSRETKQEIKELINLVTSERMNEIGESYNSLSSGWYDDNVIQTKTVLLERLRKNTTNFYKNICKSVSKEVMWSTFNKAFDKVRGEKYGSTNKDITKGNVQFVQFNIRATNDFANKKNLAYLVNIFPHTSLTMYFNRRKDLPSINQEMYALGILIQWIWRSRIRRQDLPKEQREINLYLPSLRMRKILLNWLDS